MYGQLKPVGVDFQRTNHCLTGVTPGSEPTEINVQACSSSNDASLNQQWWMANWTPTNIFIVRLTGNPNDGSQALRNTVIVDDAGCVQEKTEDGEAPICQHRVLLVLQMVRAASILSSSSLFFSSNPCSALQPVFTSVPPSFPCHLPCWDPLCRHRHGAVTSKAETQRKHVAWLIRQLPFHRPTDQMDPVASDRWCARAARPSPL